MVALIIIIIILYIPGWKQMWLKHQLFNALWYINNMVMLKQCTTCRVRSSKHLINTGLKKTTKTVSHLADSNCPLPEPSELVAVQQGAHCSIKGTNFPCWWSCLVSEPPPMQFPLIKTLGTWTHKSCHNITTVWMSSSLKSQLNPFLW